MRWLKRLFYLLLLLFIGLNVVIYNHAYKFTHFVEKDIPKFKATYAQDLGTWQDKAKLGLFGIETPKSKNTTTPRYKYEAVTLRDSLQLSAWWIPARTSRPKGTVILFHGYNSRKSAVLGPAGIFRSLGYHTFLVDLRAHGDSEGLTTTIGYYEAEDVKEAYDYVKEKYPKYPISLFGTSMGSMSILKAQHDYQMDIEKIVIECPFESMRTAVTTRFENMKIPTLLMPDLLLFWGGIQNNMSAFQHDAKIYARKVTTPVLHIYGKEDARVRLSETAAVYTALASKDKELLVIPEAGHEYMSGHFAKEWTAAVSKFMKKK